MDAIVQNTDDIGYNSSVLNIEHQKTFSYPQPIKVNFNLGGFSPTCVGAFAPILTNKLVSIKKDGERHFDLT